MYSNRIQLARERESQPHYQFVTPEPAGLKPRFYGFPTVSKIASKEQ